MSQGGVQQPATARSALAGIWLWRAAVLARWAWPWAMALLLLAAAAVLALLLTPQRQAQADAATQQADRQHQQLRSQRMRADAAAPTPPGQWADQLPTPAQRDQRTAALLRLAAGLHLVQPVVLQRLVAGGEAGTAGDDSPGGSLSSLQIDLTVQGHYADLRRLLETALAQDNALALDRIHLNRRQPGSAQLDAALRFVLFERHGATAAGTPPAGTPPAGSAAAATAQAQTRVRPAWPDALPAALAAWSVPTAPPPPPARPLPSTTVASVAPPAAPPPPVAPRPGYSVVGVLQQATGWTALLAGPQRSLAVRVGDVMDSQWRVDLVSATGVAGTWLPQGLPYSLPYTPQHTPQHIPQPGPGQDKPLTPVTPATPPSTVSTTTVGTLAAAAPLP